MLTVALSIAFGSIALAIIFCTLRLHQSTSVFFEAALLIAMIGFVATVALARYLARDNIGE